MGFTKAGRMVDNFDSIGSKGEIDVIKLKNRYIESSTLKTNNLSIIMAIKGEDLYIRHLKSQSLTGSKEYGHYRLTPDMIDWKEFYLSEEEDKAKNDMMTSAAYISTGNAMQSFDHSQLYIILPFENPETGEKERLEFKLKNSKRLQMMQRFLERNQEKAQSQENESSEENKDSPMEILKREYAKGEISEEEIKDLQLRFNIQKILRDFKQKGSKELPLRHYDL